MFAQMIPDEALFLKEQGDRAITKGDIRQGASFYERALRVYPDFPIVVYYLGLTYDLDFDDPINAIYYYRRYLELEPYGPYSSEVSNRLKSAEERVEERKIGSGIIERGKEPEDKKEPESFTRRGTKTPVASTTQPRPSDLNELGVPKSFDQDMLVHKKDNVLTLQIKEKLLKYDLKLAVWDREGFIDKFNELAQMRASPLEMDIAGKREALRVERKKVTDFIDYQNEALNALFKKANLKGMSSLGIELDHFPEGWPAEAYVKSYKVTEIEEDDRFINLSVEIYIDMDALGQGLSSFGYIFEPNRITLILQGAQGNLAESLIDHIIRNSNYTGHTTGGLYPVYTSLKNFAEEVRGLKIGKYRFDPISIGSNSMTIIVGIDES
ncbi:tetratricopeptide repeat protein [bacterium]|nr:tetratricopeptide repeat protein [bacterium]